MAIYGEDTLRRWTSGGFDEGSAVTIVALLSEESLSLRERMRVLLLELQDKDTEPRQRSGVAC